MGDDPPARHHPSPLLKEEGKASGAFPSVSSFRATQLSRINLYSPQPSRGRMGCVTSIDGWRFFVAALYFALAALLLAGTLLLAGCSPPLQLFYLDPAERGFQNWPRYIWCLTWALLGFATVSLFASINEKPQWPRSWWERISFFVQYPLGLLVTSSLIFSFFSAYEAMNGYIFYYITAALAFVAGYINDGVVDHPLKFVKSLFGLVRGQSKS